MKNQLTQFAACGRVLLQRIVRLIPYVRELEADNDRIRKDFGDLSANRTTLYEIAVRNGCLTAELGSEAARLIAEKFGMLLREHGAENYLEMQFHSPKVPGETLCLTLKWEAGKTPHQKRIEAERERDELKRRLSALPNTMLSHGEDGPRTKL
jgi:hypothetical protein